MPPITKIKLALVALLLIVLILAGIVITLSLRGGL